MEENQKDSMSQKPREVFQKESAADRVECCQQVPAGGLRSMVTLARLCNDDGEIRTQP